MKRSELIKRWQAQAEKKIPGGISLKNHGLLLDALCDVIIEEVLEGGKVTLPGIGKFEATVDHMVTPHRRKLTFTAIAPSNKVSHGDA